MSYDFAGNLTNDTYTGQGQRTYDAENRMKQAWANNQWQTYSYDGDGRRVKRLVNGVETWQVYGLGGELLAEYAANTAPAVPQKEYAYRNGQLLVTATAPVGTGTGLQGQYFDNMNFTNLKVARTDATVNFDWGSGTPDSSIGADTFTVRWTGKVEPQYSQTYTFYTQTDDGVRLWVNGQLLMDKWIDQGPTEWSGQIALTAGQRYDIRMDFYENGGGAMAKLSWSSASQAKQIIPQNRLYLPGSSAQVSFNWLVSDHLGTPRIVLDQTGSLSGVSRHDYLPFGEELFAAGRTPQLGYTGGDGVRQQFTLKERDTETGLDYFGARYYASTQGRFTGVDPIYTTLERLIDPQRLNLYAYTRNNPLRFTDPTGMDLLLDAKTEEEAKKKFALLQKGLTVSDRKHVQLVVGNGKNSFAKGQFGITVNADHESKSDNFKSIQKIANDKQETAVVSILSPKERFLSNVGVQQGQTVVVQTFKVVYGEDNYVSRADAVPGQTLFPLRGAPLADTVYSTSKNTEVKVANDQPDIEIVATAFHELRAHVFLSNVGRDIPKGQHFSPGVNEAAKAAEEEAKRNFRQRTP